MPPFTSNAIFRRLSQKHYRNVAAIIACFLELILIIISIYFKQTWITAILISVVPPVLFVMAVYSSFTMSAHTSICVSEVPTGGIPWAESYLDRRRAEYADIGSQISALLNTVGGGAGIIAVAGTAIQTGPLGAALNAVTHTRSQANIAPLNAAAAWSLFVVLVICLVALSPRNHPEPSFAANYKGFSDNKSYVKCLLQTAEEYEARRRMRRRLYIFAGTCFALAVGSVLLNLFAR